MPGTTNTVTASALLDQLAAQIADLRAELTAEDGTEVGAESANGTEGQGEPEGEAPSGTAAGTATATAQSKAQDGIAEARRRYPTGKVEEPAIDDEVSDLVGKGRIDTTRAQGAAEAAKRFRKP